MSLRQTKGAPVTLGVRSGATAKICFAPLWYPLDNFATSRLRAKHVAELFAGEKQWDVRIGYAADADVAVVVQLCSHSTLNSIQSNRNQFVVYDICDRFYETDNIFPTDEGPLHARARCLEVIERADALIAPSQRLREELSKRFPQKQCIYVPELVDYGTIPRRLSGRASRRVLWFGHITRGNFESARWIIDRLRVHEGYTPVVVTNPASFAAKYPAYAPFCVPWSPKALCRELADASLCVVTHAAEESSKSANRFATATMNGVPTLVGPTPACLDILQATDYGKLAIRTADDLAYALAWLSNAEQRSAYVSELQQEIWRRHAPEAVRAAYAGLFDMILQGRARAA